MGNCTLAFPGPRTPVEFGIVIYLTLSLSKRDGQVRKGDGRWRSPGEIFRVQGLSLWGKCGFEGRRICGCLAKGDLGFCYGQCVNL